MRDRKRWQVRYPPGEALLALHRRRGPVINAGIAGMGYTYLLGPEANKFVFANADAFSWQEAFQVLAPVDGPTALVVSDGADHRRRRSAVAPALYRRQVGDYVPIIAANADAVIDRWRPGQRIDIYDSLRAAVRRSIIESLFGTRIAAHADFLGDQLEPLLALTHRPPQVMQVQQLIGSPGWRRAMTARARIDDFVDSQVADARIHPRPDDHLLTMLISSRSDDGQPLTANEIRDQIVSLIVAGYETTSGAVAWAIYALLNVPGAWASTAAEVGRVVGTGPPTAQNIGVLTYLNGVVQETLRLYSPGVISARKVKRDLMFDGHRIPAGRLLIFSAYVTHRISDVWTEPEEFRPQRWDPDSPQYHRPAPYEFIPFSAGLHRCVGSVMATTEMTVMLARLVARTTLGLPSQRIRARNFAALRPWPGLTVEVKQVG
ncbi:MAG: cytochrome P450 [Mycobacterium sp.]|nr:cytochrome P450 [Mycobacterium sp.]